MPTLETADGKPVDVTPVDADAVNREFAAAMADDGPDTQAPPKRQPKSATPVADPKPKRGRPPKAEQARTTAKAGTVLDDGQRAQGVKGFAQIGAGIALLFGKATGKDAYKADAVTIASARPTSSPTLPCRSRTRTRSSPRRSTRCARPARTRR